ncbi:MAG: OB-fold nucleic acid binding domain-containing protein [Candidatus Bathyarchaeota archaeon]|nr:OB-fold nucleic acid binding domain-containing protein [Candidatus Termiticorpusculum sp.]
MLKEDIVAAILAKYPELSEQQIEEMFVQEKKRSGGLIGDETLLRLIAVRYDVKVDKQVIDFDRVLSSGRLFSGLNDVSVEGRLVAVFPVHSFNNGEKSGKLANLMIVDEDSILRVVLWNDKAEIVESGELQIGQIVKFLHGYTRSDQFGRVELHLGNKSRIEINGTSQTSYPDVEKFVSKIVEIANTFNNVHLAGMVKEVLVSKTFVKGDGGEGKLLRFVLSDDSAETTVVVWNGKVDELEGQLSPRVCLYLINGKIKERESGGFEVHVDSSSFVHIQPVMLQMSKIANLKEGDVVNVEGNVSNVDAVREVTTGKGEQIKLLTFELRDETGSVTVTLWREQAEQFSNLRIGDNLTVKNGYIKMGYGNKLELTTRSGTQFTVEAI